MERRQEVCAFLFDYIGSEDAHMDGHGMVEVSDIHIETLILAFTQVFPMKKPIHGPI